MSDEHWNPWKLTSIGMALVIITALITGVVVANWSSVRDPARDTASSAGTKTTTRSAAGGASVRHPGATPPASAIEACNQYAKSQSEGTPSEVVKDALIAGAVGAGVGAAGGAIADGGKGAGKGAAIGGLVGAAAGTLYGLNEAKRNDAQYVAAYQVCMKGRGYSG